MKGKRVVEQNRWRVYGVKYPMDFEGNRYQPVGRATWQDGWFWIRCGTNVALFVRVHGLRAARDLCRLLNLAESMERRRVRER